MLDREACERRVYRLATLLTGSPNAATAVITAVVDAQPRLDRLDGAHLDRLAVLRSRDVPAGALATDAVERPVAERLHGLTGQQREAWVLGRVYRLTARETARAMDCSVTATERHLAQADETMAGGDAGTAAEALLAYSMTIDVPGFYRAARRRRRRTRRLLVLLAGAVTLAAIIALMRWHGRDAMSVDVPSPGEAATPARGGDGE